MEPHSFPKAFAVELALIRFRRSGLIEGLHSSEDVASQTVGIQAQALAAASLALRARCVGFQTVDLTKQPY